jgi:hypothetical protein
VSDISDAYLLSVTPKEYRSVLKAALDHRHKELELERKRAALGFDVARTVLLVFIVSCFCNAWLFWRIGHP